MPYDDPVARALVGAVIGGIAGLCIWVWRRFKNKKQLSGSEDVEKTVTHHHEENRSAISGEISEAHNENPILKWAKRNSIFVTCVAVGCFMFIVLLIINYNHNPNKEAQIISKSTSSLTSVPHTRPDVPDDFWDVIGRPQDKHVSRSMGPPTPDVPLMPKMHLDNNPGLSNIMIPHYTELINIGLQDSDIFYKRGMAYADIGNYLQAINDLSAAIRLNNRDSTAYYNRGAAYAILGNNSQAIEDFKIAARLGHRGAKQYLQLTKVRW